MKFITEEDLRYLYKKEPFTTYEIEPGTNLTPGARQFLADRGINLFDDETFVKKFVITSSDDAKKTAGIKTVEVKPDMKQEWKKKKLHIKMKSMEALILLTGEELLSRDVFLAQSVINLGKQFTSIRNFVEGKGLAEMVCCQECSGMNADNFCKDIDDCFEITEFHMQLVKGKEILILHRLRSALREVEPIAIEVYEGRENEITENVNRIVNAISQMICTAVGGKECQRRN